MLSYRTIKFFSFACVIILSGCTSLAQISNIKILEDNQQKKYTLIKTNVFKRKATILRDTTNEFNRFAIKGSVKQYTLSLADVQVYEDVLKNSFVANNEIINNSDANGESIIKHFKTFNRQYSGYIDNLGDTLLVVCFIDFSNKKKAKEFFYDWKYQQIFLGSSLFLDRRPPSMYCYALNLRTKSLSRYKI